jgi:hypothetical protein
VFLQLDKQACLQQVAVHNADSVSWGLGKVQEGLQGTPDALLRQPQVLRLGEDASFFLEVAQIVITLQQEQVTLESFVLELGDEVAALVDDD